MTSNRPYLIRALYEWIADNGMTPHLVVNAEHPSAQVPGDFVENGRIVLNVAPQAVQGLQLGNDLISFSARFGGRPFVVQMTPLAVLGIYARENGHGMIFPDEEPDTDQDAAEMAKDQAGEDAKSKPARPALRVVK